MRPIPTLLKKLRSGLILMLITALCACNLPKMQLGLDAQTRGVLENAIDELGNWPGEWQTTLTGVVDELGEVGSELANDIRQEVESLIRATVQTAQEASFCEIDFIGIRARQHLQAILHEFFSDAPPAVFTPIICTINPTIVQSADTNQVEYSGFDFFYFRDSGVFSADLVYGDTGELIRANFGTVNVSSNYHFVVNIQGYDYSAIVASRHPTLVVKWNSDTVEGQSEVPINIVSESEEPPAERYIYELDGAAAYEILAGGPNRGSAIASLTCPSGSILTGMFGDKGDYITKIGLLCSPLNLDGSTGERVSVAAQGASRRHEWSAVQCPPDSAFAGMVGVYGSYVDRIQGVCMNIVDEVVVMNTGWAGEGGTLEEEVLCAEGDYVTGIKIRWGDYIDGLTLVCTPVIQVVDTSTPGTATDFNLVPTSTPGTATDFILVPTAAP